MSKEGWLRPPRGETFIINHRARDGSAAKSVRDNRFAMLRKRTDDARLDRAEKINDQEVWEEWAHVSS